jgi:hypothetical protein
MKFKVFSTFIFLSRLFFAQTDINQQDTVKSIQISWEEIIPGFSYCETDAPYLSILNDSKITFLKIIPKYFDFQLLIATENGKKSLTVDQWADSFRLNIVINAGMYDLAKQLSSKGYLQNYKHKNNPKIHPNYNSIIAFNPKDSHLPKFTVLDLQCETFENIKSKYNCLAQGLRMLDCNGEKIGWNKRKQSCSMLLTACDEEENIYFIFTRSPYTHNEMIHFLKKLPFKLINAIYLEGGPQTSLYVDVNKANGENFCIQKVGSYVSETYPTDKNDYFWKLPNVIGLKVK